MKKYFFLLQWSKPCWVNHPTPAASWKLPQNAGGPSSSHKKNVVADKKNMVADMKYAMADKKNMVADKKNMVDDKKNVMADNSPQQTASSTLIGPVTLHNACFSQ